MLAYLMIIPVAAVVIAVAAACVKTWRTQSNNPDNYLEESDAVVQCAATVKEKLASKVATGSLQVPGHYIAWCIRFAPEKGDEVVLAVGEDAYGKMEEGQQDTLVYQGSHFIAFGDIEPQDTTPPDGEEPAL